MVTASPMMILFLPSDKHSDVLPTAPVMMYVDVLGYHLASTSYHATMSVIPQSREWQPTLRYAPP